MSDQEYRDLKSEFESFKQHYAQQVESLQERISELEEKIEGGRTATRSPLEDFVDTVNPENHQQCAVAIGYYYDKEQGKKFTMEDIEEGFEKSRWKKYSNMSMLKSKLVNEKEWFMEAGKTDGSKKLYKLTKPGINYVKGRLEE